MTDHIAALEGHLTNTVSHFKEELSAIRGNRPSLELVENIRLTYYDQPMTIKQLGSLSIEPPRNILITVWDQAAVTTVMKAIQDAQVGLSTSNEGTTIRASMSALTAERKEELTKMVKKMAEGTRITIRNQRDDAMKGIRAAKEDKEISEDQEYSLKDRVQVS